VYAQSSVFTPTQTATDQFTPALRVPEGHRFMKMRLTRFTLMLFVMAS
jgi:hypothetical protein